MCLYIAAMAEIQNAHSTIRRSYGPNLLTEKYVIHSHLQANINKVPSRYYFYDWQRNKNDLYNIIIEFCLLIEQSKYYRNRQGFYDHSV
jgi:hypothetical protein